MSALVDALLSSGRTGGVISLLIAAGLFGFTAFDYVANNGFFIVVPAIGLVFVIIGGLLLVHGNPQSGEFRQAQAVPLDPDFQDRLRNMERPYFVCTRCRSLPDQQFCDACGGNIDVLEIRDDEDLRLALASMGQT
ncbi:MAG TPA: hypothetical protein QGF58_25965 [Myxococcota bacterium]|nr:hypothetical protein [Myxococcota bacterium]